MLTGYRFCNENICNGGATFQIPAVLAQWLLFYGSVITIWKEIDWNSVSPKVSMGRACRNPDMVNARHCLFCDLWNVPEKNLFCFVFCLMPLDPDLGFFWLYCYRKNTQCNYFYMFLNCLCSSSLQLQLVCPFPDNISEYQVMAVYIWQHVRSWCVFISSSWGLH